MRKYFVLSMVVSVLVFGAAPAGADLNNYVVGKLGFFSPTSDELSDFSTGFSGEAAIGHYFNPNVALEFGFGYFRTEGDVTVINSATFFGDEEIEVTPLTVSLRLIQPLSRTTEIYAIGGVGAYFVHDSIDASNSFYGHIHLSDDTTAFGAHLGGGINYNLNRNVFIGGEFKYVWVNADLYGDDLDLSGFRVTGNIGVRF